MRLVSIKGIPSVADGTSCFLSDPGGRRKVGRQFIPRQEVCLSPDGKLFVGLLWARGLEARLKSLTQEFRRAK